MRRILGWGGGMGAALSALLLLCSCEITERQVRQGQQIDALREQVLRLERAVDELQKSRPEPVQPRAPAEWNERLADLGQRVEALDARVRELLGRVDALERRPRPAAPAESPRLAQLEKQLAELSRRVKTLEERPQPSPQPGARPAPPAPGGPEPAATRPPTGRELYDKAYGLYQKGRYEDARRAFRKFLDLYPKSDLADNAYFWIGESYYAQEQYEKAILAYDKVVQEFPRGDKVPSALLKQAFAFDAIGDPVDARILLKKLLREHPSSEQAEIARKKLRMLGE